MGRVVCLVLAYVFLALAVIGILLPGLPTVPFLLLTAWFAAKGSESLHQWLYAHPHLGRLLIDWEQRKAISRRSKILAITMLLLSWIVMFHQVSSMWMIAGISVLFTVVGTFIATRPE